MGQIIFHGKYDPQLTNGSTTKKQTISVTVPKGFPLGKAQLNVAHMALVGVSVFVP
jgi:hypothetical protein